VKFFIVLQDAILQVRKTLEGKDFMSFWAVLIKRKVALVGFMIISVIFIFALVGPFLAPYSPTYLNATQRLKPPSVVHYFGTDNFGRDIFSRIVFAARTSILGSAGVVTVAIIGGVTLGMLSGYFRRLEPFIMRLVDVLMAFPSLLMALVLVSVLGRGMINVILAVGMTYMTRTTRIIYALALKIREEPYIEAIRSVGAPESRIIMFHLLPNMTSPIIVQATFTFAFSLLDMAALDFLGLGIPPEIPSWGNMLSEGRTYLTIAPWLLFFPGSFIVFSVLSFNLLGDVLRDRLDPHFRKSIEGI
jgi:peptide/nickel transport system permease protein